MRKLLICLAALSGASAALAQSLPSPVFKNLTVNGAITAPEFPNLSTSVEGTGVPGLDGGHWYLYNGFSAFDPTPTFRADRYVSGTQVGSTGSTYHSGFFQTTTGVNEQAYEWPLMGQVINYSNASTAAQHVAVAGYMLRNPPPNTAATTAASGNGSTATITFSGGATIPVGHSVAVAGVTPSGYNGNYKVTASSAGSVSFASTTTGAQTGAGTAVDISLAPGWASNFVCTDQAGEPDPVTACIAQELDSYTNYSGTDANKSRVTLQMMAGTGHVSRGILQGTKAGGVYDRAYELDGTYGFGLDFTNGAFSGPVALLAPNQTIAFDSNTSGVYARALSYNSTSTALQYSISGSTAFSVSDSGIASANSYASNAGNNLGLTAPTGNSVQIGINGTSGVWTFDAGGFYPTNDNTRTLGTAAYRWSTGYFVNVGAAATPVALVTANRVTSGTTTDLTLTAAMGGKLQLGVNGVDSVYTLDIGGFYPQNDNSRTLGAAADRWSTLYAANVGTASVPVTLLTATTINSDNGSNLSLTASASHLLAFGINGVNDVYEMDAGGEHPTSDNTRTLGTSSLRWSTGYFVNLGSPGTPITNGYFATGGLAVNGAAAGSTAIASANSSATNYTWTIPASTDTFVGLAATQTLTGKTVQGTLYTIAGLPTCTSTNVGMMAWVSNGVTSPTYHLAVSSTGTGQWPVYCTYNGTTYSWVY